MWGYNDTMTGGSPASDVSIAHVHGIRLRDWRTDREPITREEYRRRYGI